MTAPREAPVNIVFLDRDTLRPDTVLRAPAFPHALRSYPRTRPEELDARIAEAEIVITNKVPLPAEAIARAGRLRFVAVAATGVDMVDLAACRARGVAVSNIRGYALTSVPEHVFALIFALRRSLVAYRDAVRAGRWQAADQFSFFDYPVEDLGGATLGIVGRGALGEAVGRIAAALGMRVQFAARKDAAAAGDGRVGFAEMLRTSDVISLHCPLTPQTRGLIGDAEFQAMARRPLLINTARGGLVDEDALERALAAGLIAGAGFDVAAAEPPPADGPLMRLARRPDVIVTPHMAWASRTAVQALADQLVDNLEAFVAGAPKNRVA
jgi:glycerate dehydrogenase